MDAQKEQKITVLKEQVNTVSAIVYDNLDKYLERDLRLGSMQRRSEELQAASSSFQMTARKSKRELWWINAKWKIITAVVVTVISLILLLVILRLVGVIR
ncbi:unnamed protein product [Caenorhabditis angaria]|uniref:V-SNARE coiled-coil homology domain-containing protein n=1 Tax=Caenorhabditis angaria TaxID=860376 RepID=A0A9P1IN68_9PELO|nr:unnamed protein product [Caenorhabditis angaria]